MTDKLVSIETVAKTLNIDMNSALAEFSALRAHLFVSQADFSALALKRLEDLSKPVAVKAPKTESHKSRSGPEYLFAPEGAEVVTFAQLARETNRHRSQIAKLAVSRGAKVYHKDTANNRGAHTMQRCILVSDVPKFQRGFIATRAKLASKPKSATRVENQLPEGHVYLKDLIEKIKLPPYRVYQHCKAVGCPMGKCRREGVIPAVSYVCDDHAAKILAHFNITSK